MTSDRYGADCLVSVAGRSPAFCVGDFVKTVLPHKSGDAQEISGPPRGTSEISAGRAYVRPLRFGRRLTPYTAAILDAVVTAGVAGISAKDLRAQVWLGVRCRQNVKTHIHEVNYRLHGTGFRLVSEPRWFLKIDARVSPASVVEPAPSAAVMCAGSPFIPFSLPI